MSYDTNELEKAKDTLLKDRNSGMIGRSIPRRHLTGTASKTPNLWEGGEGMMEHIGHSFPMPQLCPKDSHVYKGKDNKLSVENEEAVEIGSQKKKAKKKSLQ